MGFIPMATDDQDPRAGLPSASGMGRIALCPGSWRASKLCPEQEETEAQKQGTRLHKHMEDGTLPYDEDERAAVEWCRQAELELTLELFPVTEEERGVIREQRLWNAIQTFSGQADVIYMAGSTALVLDYKFGRTPAPAAENNLQLAALAVLLADNYPQVREVYAGILQPWVSRQTPQLARFDAEDLEQARQYVNTAVAAALLEDAPLVAGEEQCRWCPCAASCPAMVGTMETLTVARMEAWVDITPARKAELWRLWKACEEGGKLLKKLLMQDLEAGLSIPGLRLGEGKRKFKVSDLNAVFTRLADEYGVTGDEFSACVSVSMTELDKVFHRKAKEAGETKNANQSKALLRDKIAPFGRWEQDKPGIATEGGAA